VQYLREARALGDILIVGLNSDASVARLKGPGRPVMKIDDRIALLTALRAVDHVVVFEDATAERLVEAIRPKFWVKGGDYRSQYPPEARVAERYGGEFRALAYVTGISTSKVIDNITSNRLA
jgi:rfaE bifunctional protein nucleotidyltransferase chain/domain